MGTAFIQMLKPMVKALNTALSAVYSFVETVVNALGKIFGWKMEKTKPASIDTEGYDDLADTMDDISGGADNTASGLGKAADNAKKLNKQLQKVDELNVLHSDDIDKATGGNGGKGGSAGASGGLGGEIAKTNDSIFDMINFEKPFKSKIDNLKGLGNYIRDTLIKEIEGIEWEKIYSKAEVFGSGLANFLNGLFEPNGKGTYLLGTLGSTIAKAINTGAHFVDAFSDKANWTEFGKGIKQGLNNFFEDWDAELTGEALASLTNGIIDMLTAAIPTDIKTWEKWGKKLNTALNNYLKKIKFKKAAKAIANLTNGIFAFIKAAIPSKEQWETYGKKLNTALTTFFRTFKPDIPASAAAKLLNGIVAFINKAVPKQKDLQSFGAKIGTAINTFFKEFDFKAAGEAINKLADGLLKFLISAVEKVDWDKVGKSIGDFFSGLKPEQIIIDFLHLGAALTKAVIKALANWAKENPLSLGIAISAVLLKFKGKALTASILSSLISTATFGLFGKKKTVSLGTVIGQVLIDKVKTVLAKGYEIVKTAFSKVIELGKVAGRAIITKVTPILAKGYEIAKVAFGKVLNIGKVAAKVTIDKLTPVLKKGVNLATGFVSKIKDMLIASGFVAKAGGVLSIALPFALTATAMVGVTYYNEEHKDDDKTKTDPTEIFGNPSENKNGIQFWKDLNDASDGKDLAKNTPKIAEAFGKIAENIKKIANALKKKTLDKLKTFSYYVSKAGKGMKEIKGKISLKVDNLKKAATDAWDDLQTYWEKNKPNLSFGAVVTGITTIKERLREKWEEIKGWWNKTLKPKLNIGAGIANLKEAVSEKWNSVKNWFSKKALSIKFKLPTVGSLVDKVKSLWNSLKKKVKGLFTINVNASSGNHNPPTPAIGQKNGGVWNAKTGQKYFASGGYPNSADIFMANENGVPELVGTMGRRTAVASGREITGITNAVNAQSDREAALLSTAIKLLGTIASKEFGISEQQIGKAARNYGKEYYNRTGDNAYLF